MQAFGQVLTPEVLLIVVLASAYGVFMGSTPGLTATMSVALFVPMTFWLDPVPAVAAIVAMSACAIFAGDIPTTLLRIPGTPASAAYVDDAYWYTRRGRSDEALGVALLWSVAGGLFGAVVLILLGAQLAKVAAFFSVAEYFWLYLLGLSSAVIVSRGSVLRGLLGLFIGLLLSTVGLSAVHTQARFTFGVPELYQGISFIPAMIGLFGLSEVLRMLMEPPQGERPVSVGSRAGRGTARSTRSVVRRFVTGSLASVFGPAWRLLKRRTGHWLRSSSVGALIGMLPGAGADIAAWVSIGISQRFSEAPEAYGEGSLEGLADATGANNAALAGTWIPAMVFGIPGDSITAIVIGVLLMKGLQPGPLIFEEQTVFVYSLYLAFIVANVVLIPIGFLAIKVGGLVVRIPRQVLLPIIVLFCIIGAYAIEGSYFDVGVMLGMGLLGFVLERREVPLGPVVLGIILGGPLEARLIQTLTASGGSVLAFFNRPAAAVLGVLTIALWVSTAVMKARRRSERNEGGNEGSGGGDKLVTAGEA